MAGRMKEIGPLFLAGLIIVILGAVVVLLLRRMARAAAADAASRRSSRAAPVQTPPAAAAESSLGPGSCACLRSRWRSCSWGAYGPVLHKGQAAMHHSRLRPLICVGLAYFLIAVIVPYFFLGEMGEASTYRSIGTFWSLLGGTFGAVGALGIIMAFNSGGKPVFVMPLVFGGAPVINTLVTVASTASMGQGQPVLLGRTDSRDRRRGDGAGARAARRSRPTGGAGAKASSAERSSLRR